MGVKEMLKAVRTLSPRERAQVRALLDTLPIVTLSPEDEPQVRLRKAGLLSETKLRAGSVQVRHTPIEIKGQPLSETITGERR